MYSQLSWSTLPLAQTNLLPGLRSIWFRGQAQVESKMHSMRPIPAEDGQFGDPIQKHQVKFHYQRAGKKNRINLFALHLKPLDFWSAGRFFERTGFSCALSQRLSSALLSLAQGEESKRHMLHIGWLLAAKNISMAFQSHKPQIFKHNA